MEESTVGSNTIIRNNTDTSVSQAPRIVRVNWLKFLYYTWKRISKLSRLVVSFSVLLVLLQVATAIAILITSSNESCDQSLRTFIIVYMVRVMISCPFHVGNHFQRADQRLSMQTRRVGHRDEQVRLRRVRRREERRHTASTSTVAAAAAAAAANVANNQTGLSSSNSSIISTVTQPRSNWFTSWGERLKSLVDLFAVLWFIVGNYLLFTTQTCSRAAPQLYYTTLSFTLIGYFVVILPLLLCTSVILCLPCVLMVMRELNMTDVIADQGGRSEEIGKIPVFRFKVVTIENQPQVTKAETTDNKGFVSRLFQGYRNHGARPIQDPESGTVYEDMFITPAEDALCCICLSEYEENDLLCRLWCHHHFHKSCLTEWLTLNRKCPLCKQDFRGKEYQDSDDEQELLAIASSSRNGNEFQMNDSATTNSR